MITSDSVTSVPRAIAPPIVEALRRIDPTGTSNELFRARTVWPFDLFPNELIIQEGKIVYHQRFSPWDDAITTLMVSNIVCCKKENSLFMASITLQDKFGDEITMRNVRKSDALTIKELIDGLMVREKHNIDLDGDDAYLRMKLFRLLGHLTITSS